MVLHAAQVAPQLLVYAVLLEAAGQRLEDLGEGPDGSELEDELLGCDPSLMPGGQRRLVTATSALVLDPDVVVLDEPWVGLDAASRRKIERMIERLRKGGKAVVLIDHDMDLICEVADTVTVLNEGRVALHGPTGEVFARKNWDTLAEMYIRPSRAALLAEMVGLDALSFEELGSKLVAAGDASGEGEA
ncbi:hypothetical protein RxyAA322_27860 [Rubrobacter xylanophilus]|uniref:ABC transporter domain-containing protein n=1 Tax=Rubrobacter xylanophilus TaxID=49319 RepID=A0A510HLU7_9ACTN|nr:hypothetical protein [Rubrobacter xylanophilus]BBL80932.1 hypothetical protein RxyAA322_27860 [Rubrobacter xylanophilus]